MRVRFAPSPTGFLHVGGARTALFNWLFARHYGGRFILRVEDTDRQRSTEESVRTILEGLQWLGITWDEGPLFQSRNSGRHFALASRLLDERKAFRCFCPPDGIERKRKEAEGAGTVWKYDRACLAIPADEARRRHEGGERSVVRFRVSDEVVTWDDLVHEETAIESAVLDDFILLRTDGTPTYNLSCVSDDIEMGITHVIRGDDHISNTPKQILLYRAAGAGVPRMAHLPLILGPDRKRLSKRHGAVSVTEYRDQGYLPEALFNYLALLGWSPEPQTGADGATVFREKLSRDELVKEFDLSRVSRSAAQFDTVKLDAMDYDYIIDRLHSDPASLIAHLKADVRAEGLDPERFDDAQYRVLIHEAAQRARTLRGLIEQSRFFFLDRVEVDAGTKAVRKAFRTEGVWHRLDATIERLESIPESEWKRTTLEAALKGFADEHAGGKLGDVAQPVRVLTTGGAASPAIDVTLELVGRGRTLERLRDECNRKRLKE